MESVVASLNCSFEPDDDVFNIVFEALSDQMEPQKINKDSLRFASVKLPDGHYRAEVRAEI